MKVISIQQPWVWCILFAGKDIENREWWTQYRGELYLHAGKKFDMEGYQWIKETFPEINMPLPSNYQVGGIVGKANLINCVERSQSKWFFGRYGFILQYAQELPFKPLRGQLGIFEVNFGTMNL